MGSNLQATLAKIRQQQLASAQQNIELAEKREESRKKAQNALNKKATGPKAPRKTKSQATLQATSSDGAGEPSGDWKTAASKPKLPLGMRQKQVLDYLKSHEASATVSEIKAATQIDIRTQVDLQKSLEANPKVGIDDEGKYFYRPDANIKNKHELLDYIRRSGAPVAVTEIQDSYKAVESDLKALKQEGLVIGLHSFDPELKCEVYYPVDTRLAGMKVDEDVETLWHQIDVPDDDEVLKLELEKNGMIPAPRKAVRKAAQKEKKKGKRKQQKLRTVTNVHMMHLFEGDAPVTIDDL